MCVCVFCACVCARVCVRACVCVCPGAHKGSTGSGSDVNFTETGPPLKVSFDRLVPPGIELGILCTRRVAYPLHHAGFYFKINLGQTGFRE